MSSLAKSKTVENLKAAFAGESQANRRYLYFAQKADIEGHNDVAAVFRSTAEGETGHAHDFIDLHGDSTLSGFEHRGQATFLADRRELALQQGLAAQHRHVDDPVQRLKLSERIGKLPTVNRSIH